MGASCYCRPDNTAYIWTKEDKDRLLNAFRKMVELEKGTSDCITRDRDGLIADGSETKGG